MGKRLVREEEINFLSGSVPTLWAPSPFGLEMKKELLWRSCEGTWVCGNGCFGKLALRKGGKKERSLWAWVKNLGKVITCHGLGDRVLLPTGPPVGTFQIPCFSFLQRRHGELWGFKVADETLPKEGGCCAGDGALGLGWFSSFQAGTPVLWASVQLVSVENWRICFLRVAVSWSAK